MRFSGAVFIVLLLGLAGCKMNVTSEIYISDVRKVVASKESGMDTIGVIDVNIPSSAKCDEYKGKVMGILRGIVKGFSPKGCKSEGMESYLILEGSFPLVHSKSAFVQAESLFGVLAVTEGKEIIVSLALDRDKYRILNDRMNNEFHQRIKIAESKLKLIINNDGRSDAGIALNGVFFDGKPVYQRNGRKFRLARRKRGEIIISNVGASSIEKQGFIPAFVLGGKSS